MGNDINLGVLFKSVCFDFFSTNIGSSVIGTSISNGLDDIAHWWHTLVERNHLCVFSVKSTECSIISGPGQVGTNCTFPFEFGGTIYNGCALDPKTNERWCATSVDKNGKFQPLGYEGQGNYGICLESCPKYDHTGNLFLCFFDLAGIWI